jgi:hypothetical protein
VQQLIQNITFGIQTPIRRQKLEIEFYGFFGAKMQVGGKKKRKKKGACPDTTEQCSRKYAEEGQHLVQHLVVLN